VGVKLFSVCGVMTKAVIGRVLIQSVGDVCRRFGVWLEYRPKHIAENIVNKKDYKY